MGVPSLFLRHCILVIVNDFENCNVYNVIRSLDLGQTPPSIGEGDVNSSRALNHVGVCDDEAVVGKYDPRALTQSESTQSIQMVMD